MASRLTAAEKLAMIQKAWDAGLIVYICTATRRTRMTAPLAARCAAAGTPLIKLSKSEQSLLMREGGRYVRADYAAIVAGAME